jgi:hypothetical protein
MNAPFILGQRFRDFQAMFSLSQTQRRLAHRAKAEALKWESQGHTFNYHNMRQESDRLWRDAKYHLAWARRIR